MLTDTKCRNAKPAAKPYKLPDGGGLHLEVKTNGVKAWRYRFELGGKESMFAIGNYATAPAGESEAQASQRRAAGSFTLAEARAERDKARQLVKQGVNPAHQRQQDQLTRELAQAVTFEAVADEWLALKDWQPETKARRLDMLERVVFPHIGKHSIQSITSAQILALLQLSATRNGPTVAAEAKRAISGIFDLAVATLRADRDPVHPIRKALPTNKTRHKIPLNAEEVGQLLRDMAGHGGRLETITAFRLLWWTLCRPGEAARAEWSEFDLDAAVWRRPCEHMKGRKEHTVPLPRQAVEALRTLQAITGRYTHLFPGRDDRTKPMAEASFRQAIHARGWAGRFSPHAARTTGSTILNGMGFNPDWIERQLAHVEPNAVRRTYNHADHFTDRIGMMQQWADLLDAWEQDDSNSIIPFKSAA
ncbi:tyrosine-type recombinase/integrase [Laribacter hongkongensis]|uniref:tyrosine-type recombinase/integrase n=1 Tax=Laribacter hongkongensis TaxID=168471 RepID=UPI001EFEE697|nr:integrase arm-type DNA-binding domain-containing protein [Laribacter hongkongensis]MCG8994500.1 tyrosine-type recombinase/integrase [Laribacter hongkongensis]MCG9010659.1 tyrosine-type recombinase/integrase [Laribacter hongkongensis]MCG9073350.1 tyrosine-type recombinase/integrase [Laribacter hongkongensis]